MRITEGFDSARQSLGRAAMLVSAARIAYDAGKHSSTVKYLGYMQSCLANLKEEMGIVLQAIELLQRGTEDAKSERRV